MADLPILFSAPMVRALIDGTKTQTRRVINFPGVDKVIDFVPVGTDKRGRRVFEMKGANGRHLTRPAGRDFVEYQYWPPIAVGDRLWVRESITRFDKGTCDQHIWYRAGHNLTGMPAESYYHRLGVGSDEQWPTGKEGPGGGAPYSVPSIFMPKWASRITLVVESVKIERLQDISEEDAIAEGIEPVYDYRSPGETHWKDYECYPDKTPHAYAVVPFKLPSRSYCSLWEEINGHGSWAENPWVVAYTFRRIMDNIDQIGGDQ